MQINLIAAMAKNRVIGNKGRMAWQISEDTDYFLDIIKGYPVILGLTNYFSVIAHAEDQSDPYPSSPCIVMSLDKEYQHPGAHVVFSTREAIEKAEQLTNNGTVFVMGGGQIYREFLPFADNIYLTEINQNIEGDVTFPEFDKSTFKITSSDVRVVRFGEIDLEYSFNIYSRVS